jgi:large subunit ribosomal protein L13
MSTTQKTIEEEVVIDASGKTLGRVASAAATSLMGKDLVSFERNAYSGRPVKIVNAGKIRITKKKLEEIFHTRYSGYPGGLKILKGSYTVEKKGYAELIKLAIYHMLPGNKLRREMVKNLVVTE